MSINLTDEIEVKTKKGKLCAAKQIFLKGDTKTVENEIQDINSRHNTLNTKHESLSRTVQGIAATSGASTANNVTYNNNNSGLNAENVQDAIDELVTKNKSQDAIIAAKAEKSDVQASVSELNAKNTSQDAEIAKKANTTDVASQMQTEQNRVNVELEKKFNKENILQESGEAEDKVMSQKAVSTKLSDLVYSTKEEYIIQSEEGKYIYPNGKKPIKGYVYAYIEENEFDNNDFASIQLLDKESSKIVRQETLNNNSTSILLKYEKEFILQINYRATNKKITLNINNAAYNYNNDLDKSVLKKDIEEVTNDCIRYIMNENYDKIVYSLSKELLAGNQSSSFSVELEQNKLYYIYAFSKNAISYNSLEISRVSDNKIVFFNNDKNLNKIDNSKYGKYSFTPTSSETFIVKNSFRLSQSDTVYIIISTEEICIGSVKFNNDRINKLAIDTDNSVYSLSFKQAVIDGSNTFAYNELCCSADISNINAGIYNVFFDKDIYVVSFKSESNILNVSPNSTINIKSGITSFLMIRRIDGSKINPNEGYNISLKKANYEEIDIKFENGSFDGSANDVAHIKSIRTQKIKADTNCRYFVLFPNTISCTINLEGLKGYRLNRAFLYPTSIIDAHDYIRLAFTKKDGSALQIDSLSEKDKKNIKIIKLYGKSENFDITIAAPDTPQYLAKKADIVCTSENAEIWLRAIIGSLYSIKALLYPGTYELNTLVETVSKQTGCLITTTNVSEFTDVTHIELHGYTSQRRKCILKVSENLYNSIKSDCSILLCPHNDSNLISPTTTGINIVLENLNIFGAGYEKPIVYIDMTDAQSTQINQCNVYGDGISKLRPFKKIPNISCVGIRAGSGSNNGIQQQIKHCSVFMCGTGLSINGEHFIIEDVLTHHCYVGFAFGDRAVKASFEHPNIMLGCSIEGCYRFMTLSKNGVTEEKDFDEIENFTNKIRSTLICIGLSTEATWSVPYIQKFDSPDSLPSDNNVGDSYLVGTDTKKIYTWNGSSWDISTSTETITKGILEYVKGIYRGRIEGDFVYIEDKDSCKHMELVRYHNIGDKTTFIKRPVSIDENWNGM